MTLIELAFAMFWLVVIVFGSVSLQSGQRSTHRVMQWNSLRTSGCLHCYGAEC